MITRQITTKAGNEIHKAAYLPMIKSKIPRGASNAFFCQDVEDTQNVTYHWTECVAKDAFPLLKFNF